MRLPITAHTSRPWRIHEVARDFQVQDVWALPTPGGPGELPRLVAQMASSDFPSEAPRPVVALAEARTKLGQLLGWDSPEAGAGAPFATLRDRLPADLHAAPVGPDFAPLNSVFLLEDEFAAEMVNRVVHAVMHIGWVADEDGGYRGQMAVLAKPSGRFGAAYMAAITPFRHLIVFPALMRWIGRKWQARLDDQ